MPSSHPLLFDQPQAMFERIMYNVEKVMVGKKDAVEKAVIALLCGGHILLEDVPGVGKTMLVRALARTVGCDFKRIQFTPDLLPSDITGVSVYNQRTGEFEFRPGPLMTNIVLADELNRASPKTQAALLEAMEEKRVTVDGVSYALPRPFLILATQNPIEYEGTYALPEAQLDRFFLRIRLGYPKERDEVEMLGRLQEKHPLEQLKPVIVKEELVQLHREISLVHVDDTLKQYIVQLVAATRTHKDLLLGASPRASLALMRAAQATAFIRGRSYAVPDDIKEMIEPVVAHRLLLHSDARMTGKTSESILRGIVEASAIPAVPFASSR
jgi:MoxR-like ATPase